MGQPNCEFFFFIVMASDFKRILISDLLNLLKTPGLKLQKIDVLSGIFSDRRNLKLLLVFCKCTFLSGNGNIVKCGIACTCCYTYCFVFLPWANDFHSIFTYLVLSHHITFFSSVVNVAWYSLSLF